MAGPDNVVRRDDGIVRAKLEARYADPKEFDVSLKILTVHSEDTLGGGGTEYSFPVIELDGYKEHDMFRFATTGSSWNEEQVVGEETICSVDLSEIEFPESHHWEEADDLPDHFGSRANGGAN